MDVAGFMPASQTFFVFGTIDFDVRVVIRPKLFAGCIDVCNAAVLAHIFCTEISVCARAVPISRLWFWVKLRADVIVFAKPVKEPSGQPELIRSLQWRKRANLKFPLRRHHFCVYAAD